MNDNDDGGGGGASNGSTGDSGIADDDAVCVSVDAYAPYVPASALSSRVCIMTSPRNTTHLATSTHLARAPVPSNSAARWEQVSMEKYHNDLIVAQAAQRRIESEVKLLSPPSPSSLSPPFPLAFSPSFLLRLFPLLLPPTAPLPPISSTAMLQICEERRSASQVEDRGWGEGRG